jgi:hypothetical protein
LLLSACSFVEASSPAPELPALAAKMEEVFKSLKLPGSPEVSALRAAHPLSPTPWIVCLRSDAEEDRRAYALFVRDDAIVQHRLAVLIDQCEKETFVRLDRLKPAGAPADPVARGRKM